jgi:hypothetical protein
LTIHGLWTGWVAAAVLIGTEPMYLL